MWRWLLFWLLPRRSRRAAARALDLYDLSRGRVTRVERRWLLRAQRRQLRRWWR